jgi:hypothetical protein
VKGGGGEEGERERERGGAEVRRYSQCVCVCGGGDMEGHVLRETTSRGLCGLGCPSRTSERGGEGDYVKEGGGEVVRAGPVCLLLQVCVKPRCVFYYCRTYYKAVRVGGGGEWRTCAMRWDP